MFSSSLSSNETQKLFLVFIKPFLHIIDFLLESQQLVLRRIVVVIFIEEFVELFLGWRSNFLMFFILYEIFKPSLQLIRLHDLTPTVSLIAAERLLGLECYRFGALVTYLVLKIMLLRRFLDFIVYVFLSWIRISRQLLVVINLPAWCWVIEAVNHAVSFGIKVVNYFRISSLVRCKWAKLITVHKVSWNFLSMLVVDLVGAQVLVNG